MIIGVVGDNFSYNMGNLKTYTMTHCLYSDFLNGYKIFSTYGLNFPHTKLTCMGSLIKILKECKNVSIGMDELSVYFDAYAGVSKKTGTWYLKQFIRQTRKRGVKFYFTAQTFDDIHKSIRRMCHEVWVSEKLDINMKPCISDGCHAAHIQKITNVKTGLTRYVMVNPEIFTLYDSDEIVEWED